MTTNPTPERIMIVDDNGMPEAIVNMDTVQASATRLMYAMAANSHDEKALAKVSEKFLTEVGVDLFGMVCAAALKLMTTCVLEPTLEYLDRAVPTHGFRDLLAASSCNAEETL